MNKTIINNDPNSHEIEDTDLQTIPDPDASSFSELTTDEKIDIAAARILKQFKPAFEDLTKPGGKEISLLNDLWYGNIDPQNRTIPRNEEYKRILTTICEYEAKFRDIFSSEQQALVEGYENATIALNAICEEASFVYGFRLGARFMRELLAEE